MTQQLPRGFESIECFVDEWVLADSRARGEKRQATSMAEVRRFYAAMKAYPMQQLNTCTRIRLKIYRRRVWDC